jgi:hypothetical protein
MIEDKWLLFSNLLVASYLTGLIWVIQVVHYPSFAKLSPESFTAFHPFHTERISLIVALPMVIELALSGLLLWSSTSLVPYQLNVFLFVLTLILWASTFFWAIPLHNRLELGYDANIIHQLVSMNWIRTVAWTLRFGLLAWLVGKLL